MPLQQRRPAEGEEPSQQWRTTRSGREADPLASFIDTLSGPDGVIEIVIGQGRLLTLKRPISDNNGTPVIAVGDPSVVDFEILPNPRHIRLTGNRAGVTDLSITTADGQTCSFEVHVLYDLNLVRAQLRQIFPGALIEISQLREHLVVEGQARSAAQVAEITEVLKASASIVNGGQAGAAAARPQIVNLMQVPGVHQVLLQVRVAELNRTGLREIGADFLIVDPSTGNIGGSAIGGAAMAAFGTAGMGGLVGLATGNSSPSTTAFGIFPSADFEIMLRALRQNALATILAEPNLIAMSGQQASFLAGGEFPVPVSQGGAGGAASISVEWKEFGVQLHFVPYVLEDGLIRMKVTPEVSTIDFSVGATLVPGGDPVPGVTTRRATTMVELAPGQTLAIAGLLQVEIAGNTSRIPGLGDLPYIGPFFSNTSHRRLEKELVVLVTPYLVSPMNPGEVPPLPGSEITQPSDREFYLMNRLEGRTGCPYRSTVGCDSPWGVVEKMNLERRWISGPVGYGQ